MRYWLMAGQTYYPSEGIGDLLAIFETEKEARAHAERVCPDEWSGDYNWAHVIDSVKAVTVGIYPQEKQTTNG